MRRKRGQNEGSIFKRCDGRRCAVVNLGWESGRRKRKYLYGATEKEVQTALLAARNDLRRGLPVAFERQAMKQFMESWLEVSVKPAVRPLTHEQYSQHVRLYLVPAFKETQLTKLTPQQIRAFIAAQLKRGLSPRTVQISLIVLRLALDQAVKDGLIARNVASIVDAPRWTRPEVQSLDPDEARRFLTAASSERLEALYTVALSLG
jgi:hypothetical protein